LGGGLRDPLGERKKKENEDPERAYGGVD